MSKLKTALTALTVLLACACGDDDSTPNDVDLGQVADLGGSSTDQGTTADDMGTTQDDMGPAPGCSGTPRACSETFGEIGCAQVGCTWDGTACTGTPGACTTFPTTPECGNAGCTWTGVAQCGQGVTCNPDETCCPGAGPGQFTCDVQCSGAG